MKISIRKSVFETNSSSSHSLVVVKEPRPYTEEELALDLHDWSSKEKFSLFDFCDDVTYERYPLTILSTPVEKMRYYVAAKLGAAQDESALPEIISMISEATGFPPEKIEITTHDPSYEYGYASTYNDTGEHPFEFLDRKGISIKEFIFNPKYVLIVDGDEYMSFKKLFERNVISFDNLEDISSGRAFWEDSEYVFYANWLSPKCRKRYVKEHDPEDLLYHFYPWNKILYFDVTPKDFPYCTNDVLAKLIKKAKEISPEVKVILRRNPYDRSRTQMSLGSRDASMFDEIHLEPHPYRQKG